MASASRKGWEGWDGWVAGQVDAMGLSVGLFVLLHMLTSTIILSSLCDYVCNCVITDASASFHGLTLTCHKRLGSVCTLDEA